MQSKNPARAHAKNATKNNKKGCWVGPVTPRRPPILPPSHISALATANLCI